MNDRHPERARPDRVEPEGTGPEGTGTGTAGPNNIEAGPGTGDPRYEYPGGSPVDVRDGTLRRHRPLDDADPRGGGPIPGLSSETAGRNAIRSTITPSSTQGGWTAGGMAIPALLIVVLIVALAALFL